ncbi:5-hydroxytryptamine receptor 1A-like [Anopheles bellator]|uniref:5-hydroxytryptamine receptor 1A-like n=1 Tax=Anopheles bellator TaxID=139047 RepID=UPI00264797FF|nr:5-hydroxytryptamine receptor 1A-like [Anopheles bellator]
MAKSYDEHERIRYFYYIRPPTPPRKDWWFDPMGTTTTDSSTTLSASEEATLLLYDIFIPLLGSVIIILNLIVVVSAVLLLRKGQQPYTTYMFLGNVAVSDLLTGFAVIYGQYAPLELRGEDSCALMIGLIVSTSLVSVYSVGLIAIDRYLYIVYGLQYQRYLTRLRARLLIGATWIIGVSIGFLPALGWRGDTDGGRTCWFIRLAPPPLVILTSVTGILPVLLVLILYGIILRKALRRVSQLKKASREMRGVQTGNLRLFRGGGQGARHATTTTTNNNGFSDTEQGVSEDELTARGRTADRTRCCLCFRWPGCCCRGAAAGTNRGAAKQSKSSLNGAAADASSGGTGETAGPAVTEPSAPSSIKGPTKWKAVKVVMFTTGSFVVTWVPYFIASIMYVACDPTTSEELCRGLQFAIASPLAILGFANSLLNPIIYAWWHNGFRESMKKLGAKLGRRLNCCRCCPEDEDSPGGSRCCCSCWGRCCRKSPDRDGPATISATGSGSAATESSGNRISSSQGSSDGISAARRSPLAAAPNGRPPMDRECSTTEDNVTDPPDVGTRL